MAQNFILRLLSDADFISVRTGLTEEEFEQFKEDPTEFEDERIYSIEDGNFRSAEIEDEDGDSMDLDEDVFENIIDPEDENECYDNKLHAVSPVLKKKCDDILQNVEERYSCANIKELKPNTVSIIEKWHTYKELNSFDIELEDDEEFDQYELYFIRESYKPQWFNDYELKTKEVLPEDIFGGVRFVATTIVYNGKIIESYDSEDCGADLVVRYAVRTDENGDVISIEEFNIN